jgi:hypothetical protein
MSFQTSLERVEIRVETPRSVRKGDLTTEHARRPG